MKHKIVKITDCKTCKEVLVSLSRNEEGKDYIEIIAWHDTKNGMYFQVENIDCDDHNILCGIIEDFSVKQASKFANSFTY